MSSRRSRSRSPIHDYAGRSSPLSQSSVTSDKTDHCSKPKSFMRKCKKPGFPMKIRHIPKHWNKQKILEFVKRQTDPVDVTIGKSIYHTSEFPPPGQNNPKMECTISFSTLSKRRHAFDILKRSKELVEGQKFFYIMVDAEKGSNIEKNTFINPEDQQNFKPGATHLIKKSLMSSDAEEGDTFGMSLDYLQSLGVKLPLTRRIYVSHLSPQYDNEEKVRNLFRLAGNVVNVQLLFKHTYNNARIEFDHPVEAVQAISMFNGKELYGIPMMINIDSLRMFMPEGFNNFGAGLGPNQQPMRGVRVAVEMRSLRTEVGNEFQKLNETIDNLKQRVVSLEEMVQQPPPPVNQNPLPALDNVIQPLQLLQGLMPQNQGNDFAAMLQNLAQNLNNNNWQNPGNLDNQIPPAGPNMQGPNFMPGPMQGPNIMPAPGNFMQGPGNNMQGPGNNMPGPGNNMQGPGNNMPGPGNFMQGPGNNMQGPGNNMQGPKNNVQGPGNNMPGPGNFMQGPENNMQGSGNNMPGPGNFMQGPGNNMQGPGNNMPGPGNFMQGPGNNMQGPGNNMPGPGNFMQGPGNNMPGPGNNMPGNMPRGPGNFMQDGPNNAGCNMPGNSNRQNEGSDSSILLFKYLPPTVSLATLQAKMNQIGNVRLVEMTGQGRAIVKFYSEFDADKCIRLFNQSKVDGQTIDVRKL